MALDTRDQGQRPAVAQRLLTGLTAVGNSQGTAFLLADQCSHEFLTVASGTGAVLPAGTRLPTLIGVYNAGANALSVYPPSGGTINGGSANAAYSLAASSGISFWAAGPGTWYTSSGAVSGEGTVTSVATGAGLAGGPITTTGTISIAAGGVTYAKIQNVAAASLVGNPTGAPAVAEGITLGSGLAFAGATLTATGGSGTVTTVSVVTANGVSGAVANPTTTPAITVTLGAITPTTIVASGAISGSNLSGSNTGDQTITLTGPVTGTGAGSFATTITASAVTTATIAAAAVTYAKIQNEAASSLLGNPTGSPAAPSEITLGSGLAFAGSTLTATGSGGTVTSASVVSANGFAGTVATATSTPAITISTSVTGLLKGNGTAVSAAVSGTDYVVPSVAALTSLASVGTITVGTWNATPVVPTYGGTGLATLTAHAVMLGEGTSNVGFATIGTAGRVLVDQGAAADPVFATTGIEIDSHYGAITADTDGATITFNLATSDWHTVTLGGNRTLAVSERDNRPAVHTGPGPGRDGLADGDLVFRDQVGRRDGPDADDDGQQGGHLHAEADRHRGLLRAGRRSKFVIRIARVEPPLDPAEQHRQGQQHYRQAEDDPRPRVVEPEIVDHTSDHGVIAVDANSERL